MGPTVSDSREFARLYSSEALRDQGNESVRRSGVCGHARLEDRVRNEWIDRDVRRGQSSPAQRGHAISRHSIRSDYLYAQ